MRLLPLRASRWPMASIDGNRLVHRRGERFEGKISNYEYVIHRDSAYEELEFVSDPGKGK